MCSSVRVRRHAARVSVRRAGMLVAVLASLAAGSTSPAARAEPSWPTYHRDSARSGFDPEATNPLVPSLAWQSPDLGAPIWGQPLILGSRAYVATVGDDLYALDAVTGAVIWKQHAGTPVPSGQLPCGDITPTVGIVGTPVIDPSRNEVFAVVDALEGGQVQHELVGYDLTTGAALLRTPVDPPGAEPKALLQRTALNLDAGRVVFGFGGNDGDCGTYRGTVVAAPEAGGTPSYWQVPIAVNSQSGGAVWGPSGPVVDGEGHIIAGTGNPNPRDERATKYDFSDSLVELDPTLNFLGYFKPPSWEADSNSDADLGSAGPELLPGGVLFQAGKNGTGYLVAETGMAAGAPALYSNQVCGGSGSFGGDAYAAGVIYVACSSGVEALAYNPAPLGFTALWKGPSDAAGPPIVSAGLVWVIATHASSPGSKLYGLDPATGVPRYTETLPSPAIDHFASPSAAGGGLFLASGSSVTAYRIAVGPLAAAPLGVPAGGQPSSAPSAPAAGAQPSSAPSVPERRGAPISLLGTRLTVSRSGRLVVELACASWTGVCGGTITLRTLAAVTARSARARKSIILLAAGRFLIRGGHRQALTLRMRPRARRLMLRKRLLLAGVTIAMRDSAGALLQVDARATLRLATTHRPR